MSTSPAAAAPARTASPVEDAAAGVGGSRLHPVRGADHADVLRRALAARAAGLVPVVGDERWSEEQWHAAVEHAQTLLAQLTRRTPERAARIGWAAFTSGSTGRPRVILRTARSWAVGHRLAASWCGLAPGSSLLVPVHPVSSMAVNAADLCAVTGASLLVPERARLRPTDLTAPAPDAVHCTPAQLTDLCDLLDDAASSTAARGPRVALVGGDRMPAGLTERAVAHGLRVVHYYGSAEASFVAVDLDGTGLRAVPGVKLQVRAGVLHVRSSQLAEPDDSLLADGTRRWGADGWLCTGDRAELTGEGVLRLQGRADDAILTGGATVVPADVEAELAGAVDDAGARVCTGVLVLGEAEPRLGRLVIAYVEPSPGMSRETVLTVLRAHAVQHLAPAARPRRWQVVDRLERTASGKIRRTPPEMDR